MAITPVQRKFYVGLVVTSAVTGNPPLDQLLPGVTADQVLTAITNAVGVTQDVNLTAAAANYVASLQSQLPGAQGRVTDLNNQITAATVI